MTTPPVVLFLTSSRSRFETHALPLNSPLFLAFSYLLFLFGFHFRSFSLALRLVHATPSAHAHPHHRDRACPSVLPYTFCIWSWIWWRFGTYSHSTGQEHLLPSSRPVRLTSSIHHPPWPIFVCVLVLYHYSIIITVHDYCDPPPPQKFSDLKANPFQSRADSWLRACLGLSFFGWAVHAWFFLLSLCWRTSVLAGRWDWA